jgi:hypothetical protein
MTGERPVAPAPEQPAAARSAQPSAKETPLLSVGVRVLFARPEIKAFAAAHGLG